MNKAIFFILMISLQIISAQEKLPLIPYPQKVEIISEKSILDKNIEINADKNSFEAKFLKNYLENQFRSKVIIDHKYFEGTIISLLIDKSFKNDEYKLTIRGAEIAIFAKDNKGIFYGIQTLIQILNNASENKIPNVEITDSPKFQWRGMHLDCVRHFFTKDEVKRYIDFLAMYKMNTFHWHLTDDQGWRIEIKKYPKLTEIGAWRNGTMVGKYDDKKYDDKKYGGFYTQQDIKEIVKYAEERHITIVPEIEMPGHAVAAIASYPWLGCTGKQIDVEKGWGVFNDVFCPKEETFTFLENVLTEVVALFPSKIIHVGGDECPKDNWKKCEHCQNLIKKLGLKDEHELQSYFVQRIEKFLNSKGRKIIGWDEILEGGLAPNASVMSWRGTEGGIAAAKMHHDVVMTPGDFCYFDHYQGNPKNEPLAIGGYTTAEKVYSFNPIPKELHLDEQNYILGAQGNVWTEYILDFNHVQYMVFPRICALSEVLWGTNSDFQNFKERVEIHEKTLEKLNINFDKTALEQPLNLPKN